MDAWKWLADNTPDWVQGELAQEKEQLEVENAWMRREIERVGYALFTGKDGYVGTEEDLQAVGQFVEGVCETNIRLMNVEANLEERTDQYHLAHAKILSREAINAQLSKGLAKVLWEFYQQSPEVAEVAADYFETWEEIEALAKE